ncbi:MAG TPA: hypothetical protein PLB92_08480 [Rhodoglobus sp.]|nr:hypothetical protein [Rhodoglobus sp.]
MSDIVDRIADILEARGLVQHAQLRAAIAEAVIEGLGLKSEWFARHVSGGGADGFNSHAEAQRHIDEHPPRPGGVESPPDRGYVGVEHRWVTPWEPEGADHA